MANEFAYIEKTLPRVVDKVFAKESLTDRLMDGNAIKIEFLDAKTCKIFKLATSGLTNYKRGGHGENNADGSVNSSTETFILNQERYASIPLDKLDTLDDGETVLGNLSSELIRTKVVPEFDAYRFSKLAGMTSVTFGNRVEGAIAENKIIAEFNKAVEWMAEQKVPETNQILYVRPAVMTMIRNTTELHKHLTQTEYKSGDVSFTIEKYQGREIVVVPSDEFFTDIVVGDGYYPSDTSKVIDFLLVDKSCPIVVKKLAWVKTYTSDETDLGYVGYKVKTLFYHDIFVPDNKKTGIYAHVSSTSATTKSSALLADLVAGTSGKTICKLVLTQPAGIIYDKLYLAKVASTKIGTATSSYTAIEIGEEFTPDATNNIIVASYNGKVVAFSKNFGTSIPKGV